MVKIPYTAIFKIPGGRYVSGKVDTIYEADIIAQTYKIMDTFIDLMFYETFGKEKIKNFVLEKGEHPELYKKIKSIAGHSNYEQYFYNGLLYIDDLSNSLNNKLSKCKRSNLISNTAFQACTKVINQIRKTLTEICANTLLDEKEISSLLKSICKTMLDNPKAFWKL